MRVPETIAEVNEALIRAHRLIKEQGEKVKSARQDKANAKRRLELARAKVVTNPEYTSDKTRWAEVVKQTENEAEELQAAALMFSAERDELQRLCDLRDDLKEIGYNIRQHMRSLGG